MRNEYLPADGYGSFNQSAYTLLYRSESGPINVCVSQNEPRELFLFLTSVSKMINIALRERSGGRKKKKSRSICDIRVTIQSRGRQEDIDTIPRGFYMLFQRNPTVHLLDCVITDTNVN